jgi:predicted DNA-binding transcriptional regulator AlpA
MPKAQAALAKRHRRAKPPAPLIAALAHDPFALGPDTPLEAEEVAKVLNVHQSTVWDWVGKGLFPPPSAIGPQKRIWTLGEIRAVRDARRMRPEETRARAHKARQARAAKEAKEGLNEEPARKAKAKPAARRVKPPGELQPIPA